MISITHTRNGFLVVVDPPDESGPVHYCLEQQEEESDAKVGQRLLWLLVEELGLAGSRYDAERLAIELHPGDKYQEPER